VRLTRRAADGWDSARFMSIFHASGLYCSQAVYSPAAANANRWAARGMFCISYKKIMYRTKILSMGR